MKADSPTVRVTIDGRTLDVERGLTILQAARLAGVEIPTLCYHPKLKILGACRLCLVEVESLNKLIASCQTPVGEGMVVKTKTPLIRKVRRTILELLLARHPLDCLACDKGGWCDLQKLTYRYGPLTNRFSLEKEEYAVVDRSPYVERDTKKCVLCRRCIRVCRDIRGRDVWGAMYRGFDKKICTFFEQPLDRDFNDPFNCEFCGSCIDICPVGALTAKSSKHVSRPWEEETAEVSCPFCSVGCPTVAHVSKGRLVKTVPVERADGSSGDLCFRGRFATVYVNDPGRLTSCLLRRGDRLIPVETKEALAVLAEKLREGDLHAFAGTGATEQEAHALARLVKAAPGARLAALDGRGDPETGPPAWFADLIAVDELPAQRDILVVGQDFTMTHPVASVRIRQALSSGGRLDLVDPYDTLLGRAADRWLRPVPTAAGAAVREVAGTFRRSGEKGAKALVLQKIPGGGHGPVQRAVEDFLTEAAGEWKLCYLPLDCDGFGVPLMLAAAGARNEGILVEQVLAGQARSRTAVFLRADPVGESWRRKAWLDYRSRSTFWLSFESFLTDTAREADLVVPLPHFIEQEGTVLGAGGGGSFSTLRPPPEGVVSFTRVVEMLSAALEWSTGAGSLPGDAARLREEGRAGLRLEAAERGAPPPEAEETKQGRGLLLSLRFHRLPGHRMKVVDARRLLGPKEALELNPADAGVRGIEDGAQVALRIDGERFLLEALLTSRVPPGQVALPWDPAFERTAGIISLLCRRDVVGSGGVPVEIDRG